MRNHHVQNYEITKAGLHTATYGSGFYKGLSAGNLKLWRKKLANVISADICTELGAENFVN